MFAFLKGALVIFASSVAPSVTFLQRNVSSAANEVSNSTVISRNFCLNLNKNLFNFISSIFVFCIRSVSVTELN